MKKRFFLLVLALAMCLSSYTVCAEMPERVLPTAYALPTPPDAVQAGFLSKTVTKYQTYSREIKVFRELADGSFVETPLIVPMVEIAYEYTLEWGISSYKILGGRFDIYSFPQVDDSIADPIYGVTATEYLSPPIYDVDPINDGAAYLVDVRGGSFTLTYNSELYYDIYGNILPEKTKSVTTRIAYYFNRTGTWDNP